MKNRELVHKKKSAQWGIDLYSKKTGKRKEIHILKQINIYGLALKYASPFHEPRAEGKVVLAVATTFQKEEAPAVHF